LRRQFVDELQVTVGAAREPGRYSALHCGQNIGQSLLYSFLARL
jgi:hypothetical protein